MFNKIRQGNQLLQKPAGVSEFLPGQVKLYRDLEEKALKIFYRWGYEEVFVPSLEYPEMFTLEKGKFFEREMFKLSDETGRPMVLRPDFTPSIARLVSTYYTQHPTPIRLCYNGKIYRSRLTSSSTARGKEFYQMGAELIGDGVPDGDAEIAAMAAEILAEFGLEDFVISMGDLSFLDRFLSELGLSQETVQRIKETLNEGNLVNFYQVIDGLSLNESSRSLLKRLPRFRGQKADLPALREKLAALNVDDILERIDNIYQVLAGYGLEDKIVFDLSLVRNLDYYTGFVFEGYATGIGYPLCGGGRYDYLMQHYDMDLSATGFGFSMDYILKLISDEDLVQSTSKIMVTFENASRAKALQRANDLRQKGYQVIMGLTGVTPEEALKESERQKADFLEHITSQEIQSYQLHEAATFSEKDSEVFNDDQ